MQSQRFNDEVRKRLRAGQNPSLASVVERNIETLAKIRSEAERNKSIQERFADRITWFSGSMSFVYLHVAWFSFWIAANLGWLGIEAFDPFPFGLLTMIVSLEAIFLSTFVLLSQNRQAVIADQRADLDLQINLLAEHEVTHLLMLVDAIAKRVGVDQSQDPEIRELQQEISPDVLLEKLDANGKRSNSSHQPAKKHD